MAFNDLAELLDAGLSLPINGTVYLVPPVDAETGLRLQRVAELAARAPRAAEDGQPLDAVALDDAGEVDLYRDALGSAYEQMLIDQVPFAALKIAGITAWLASAVSKEAAETYWNAGGSPETLAGNRETRRKAAARSTRQPASASGTSRPRTTPPATVTDTPGTPSSTTGS